MRILIFFCFLLLLAGVLGAETLTLVPTTQTTLANGETLATTITIESDDPATLIIVQEIVTTDSLRYWRLVTTVNPDTNVDDIPEITNIYMAPKERSPFDVNEDGFTNGADFWSLFVFLFWVP